VKLVLEVTLDKLLLRDPVMRLFRVELRTMLAVLAVLALPLAWASFRGWPGDLVLSVTQFPFAWLPWSVIRFLLGRRVGLTGPRQSRGLLLTGLLVLTCVVTLCVCWARLRSFHLWSAHEHDLTRSDYGIVQFDNWLRSRSATPHFWKSNCTHSPASNVLGIALAVLMGIVGFLVSVTVRVRHQALDKTEAMHDHSANSHL